MEASQLVRLVMERMKVETAGQVAAGLGLRGYGAPKKVSRWLSGENEPDYEATLLLLRAAGLLREKPTKLTAVSQRPDLEEAVVAVGDASAALADEASRIAALMAELAELLEDERQRSQDVGGRR